MNVTKRQKIEAKGWKVTTVEDFLGLTPEDVAAIEGRLMEEAQDICPPTAPSLSEEPASVDGKRVRELVAT